MASDRIRLDPQTVDVVAWRVVESLGRARVAATELVDAGELARQLGVERSWIYTHRIELGAVKLGDGAESAAAVRSEIAARILRKGGRVGGRSARPLGWKAGGLGREEVGGYGATGARLSVTAVASAEGDPGPVA